MLKITKGLRPFIGTFDNDDRKGIHIYTDDKGDDYVRVNIGNEDFCIAAHDYTKGDKKVFTWNSAMKSLKDDGLTTFTKNQAQLCTNHLSEINDILKEIDGDAFKNGAYWTKTEYNSKWAWYCTFTHKIVNNSYKYDECRVRAIINL